MKLFCTKCKKFFSRCDHSQPAEKCAVRTITAEKLKARMEVMAGLAVINTLTKESYDKCHIKGSMNVPFDVLEAVARSWDKKTSDIVVYCANKDCPISRNAFKKLCEMGFEKVVAFEGGIDEWRSKGYPTEGTNC